MLFRSDRQQAFQADQRHVTTGMISLNVNRMVSAYTGIDQSDEAIVGAAEKAESTRDFIGAVALYQQALDEDAESWKARLGLGRCLIETGRAKEAVTALAPLLKNKVARLEAARTIASACRQNDMQLEYGLVRPILEKNGKYKSLRELIIASFRLEKFEDTKRYCEMFRKVAPRNSLADQYLSRIAFAAERWEDAERHVRAAIALNQSLASMFGLLGQLALRKGDIAEAEEALERGKALNSRAAEVIDGLTLLEWRRGDAADGEAAPLPPPPLPRARPEPPVVESEAFKAAIRSAEEAESARNINAAVSFYEAALVIDAQSAKAHLGLGRCLVVAGRPEDASVILLPLLDRAGIRSEVALALAAAARACDDRALYDACRPVLEEKISSRMLRELVLTSFHFGDFDRTKSYIDPLRKAMPHSPLPDQYLGRVAFEKGDLDAALRHFEASLGCNDKQASVFGLIAQLETSRGSTEAAERALTVGRSLGPSAKEVVDAERMLKAERVRRSSPPPGPGQRSPVGVVGSFLKRSLGGLWPREMSSTRSES